jgi:hypothetical protein
MDSFYNAPALAQKLKSLKTDCVGKLRLNRKDVPKMVKDKKLKKGELIAQHSGPVSVLKWCDKKKRNSDFIIPWGRNKNHQNKARAGKGKASISSGLQPKHGRS